MLNALAIEAAPDWVGSSDPRWREAGISYRQLDYWTQVGFLQTYTEPRPGSGRPRRWPVEELEIGLKMAKLLQAGMRVDFAADLARMMVERNLFVAEAAPGVLVAV